MSTPDAGTELQVLQQQVAQGLVNAAPPGWVVVRGTCSRAGKTGELQAVAVMQDGTEVGLSGLGFPVSKGFRGIRERLYEPGKGAWYTAVCTVTSSGAISFDLDHDNEPQWDIDVVPGTYAEDLEMFPRDEEHRPAWLQEKLRLAGG